MSLQNTTRSGGNAPGLPGGSLSRRSAIRGSAAVAMAFAAGVSAVPSAAAEPDAALVDLARRLEALIGAERDAWDRQSRAEDAIFKETPDAPVCRPVDYPDEVDGMTTWERFAYLARPGGYNVQLAVAMDEYRIAMEGHARAVAAIEKRHDLDHLERQADRASAQVSEASERLADMAATGPAGLAAKARALQAVAGGDGILRSAEFERHAALLDSLLRDAARLGSGALS